MIEAEQPTKRYGPVPALRPANLPELIRPRRKAISPGTRAGVRPEACALALFLLGACVLQLPVRRAGRAPGRTAQTWVR